MQVSHIKDNGIKNSYIIITINVFFLVLFGFSLLLLRNYNIHYGATSSPLLNQLDYNYNSMYVFSALLMYILFNASLLLSSRKFILEPKNSRDSQIVSIILMDLFFLFETLFIFILQSLQSGPIVSNLSYKNEPFVTFLDFSSFLSIVIFFMVICFSFIDIFTNLNHKSHVVRNTSNANSGSFNSTNTNYSTATTSNSYSSFISNNKDNIILAFLNILFATLTIIFTLPFITYNTTFASKSLTTQTSSGLLNLSSSIDSLIILSKLATLSFIIFLIVLSLSIKKFVSNKSKMIQIPIITLYEASLISLSYISGLVANIYQNRYIPYPAFSNTSNNIYLGQIMNYNVSNSNIYAFFRDISLLSLFAFIGVLIFLIFSVFVFNDIIFKSSSNLKIDYTRSLFTRNIVDSDDPAIKGSVDEQSVIHINTSKASLLKCPQCGFEVTYNDKFCQKCGNRFFRDRSFL